MSSGPLHLPLRDALRAFYEQDTWKCMLLFNYPVDRDTHVYRSDIEAYEVSGASGYQAGGIAVTTPVVAYDAILKIHTVTFKSAAWVSSTISATHAAWYKVVGNSSQDTLGYISDFAGTVASSNTNFIVPDTVFTIQSVQ